ncbi:MAG: flagellar biosynthesis protein FlhB [Bacillota bacterium]
MSDKNSAQQKTEPPTPYKLQQARKKGQVAKSKDLSAALILLAAVALFFALREPSSMAMQQQLAQYFANCLHYQLPPESMPAVVIDFIKFAGILLAPVLLLCVTVAFLADILQVGFLFAPEAIKPKLERLNPLEGFKRMFSVKALVELVKSILKVIIVAAAVYLVIRLHIAELLVIFFQTPVQVFFTIINIVLAAALAGGGAFLILAMLDLLFQRYDHYKNMRMTRQEVKDELKQTEGDPWFKAWQKRRQREIVLNSIRQEVPRATVVVTNPTHVAVALRYDDNMTAPRVVAKGAGHLAAKIRELAGVHGVPVIRRPEIARTLYRQAEPGQEIPVELYQAVAEIIAMVYRLKGKA